MIDNVTKVIYKRDLEKNVITNVLNTWLFSIKRHTDPDTIYNYMTEHFCSHIGNAVFDRKGDNYFGDRLVVTTTVTDKDVPEFIEKDHPVVVKMELPLTPISIEKGIIIRPIKAAVYTNKWYRNGKITSPVALFNTLREQFRHDTTTTVGYFMAAKVNGRVYKTRVYCCPDDFHLFSKTRAMYLLKYKLNEMTKSEDILTDMNMYCTPKANCNWCSYIFDITYEDQVIMFNRLCTRYFKTSLISKITTTVKKITKQK